ncbi:hypothetical protein E3E37_03485 [Thermococcus sp. ES12]|nr:hypothetical protein [Thermococcus sp. ES12]
MANVIVDFEPLLVLGLDPEARYGYPLHGFFHTLVGSSLAALLLAEVIARFYGHLGKEMDKKRLRITALAGVWLHVILDSFLYTDIRPLFPSSWNPLYGVFSSPEVYGFCAAAFLAGAFLYLWRGLKERKGIP